MLGKCPDGSLTRPGRVRTSGHFQDASGTSRTLSGRPDSRTRFHFHDLFKGTKQIYENNIVNIDQYIENDKLIIYNNAIVFEKFSYNGNIIEDKYNKFKPENLSKYFDDYFLYHERNDIFVYCNHL